MLFFCLFQCFEGKGYQTESKRNRNGTKPSRGSFLEKTQTRRLGVEVRNSTKLPRGGGRAQGGRHAPHPRGPHGAPPTHFFRLYILLYPKNIRESPETSFPLPQPSVPVRSHLGAFSLLRQRGNRSRRASTSTP